MKLYAAVVNTYGKVGQEFVDYCSVVDNNNRGKGRGRDLTILLSLLGVYTNAEKVVGDGTSAWGKLYSGSTVKPL